MPKYKCEFNYIQAAADITGPLQVWPYTVLYCIFRTVLYKKRRMKEGKMRKFAYKHAKNKEQTDVSTTESTLILSGYSRELANNCTVLHSSVLYCIKREGWKREKWENLQTKNREQRIENKRFNNWVHSNPLWILEGAGQ